MQIRENLKKGTVEMIMLHLLLERKMYGYELLQEMKIRSNEKFILKDGSMYPILYRMIDKGLITDEQVLVGRRRTRVYYHITEEGKKYLEEIKMEYQLITEGITNILEYQEEKKCELPNENENNI
ncbi:MAG: helix-turn-helix transcriptional regulator [Ruminococcus sp.]|jgi:PadR family transcriptional regulator PadR|nr:helix-turn-helix transcriptional regulator [Ruminococcus sp.]